MPLKFCYSYNPLLSGVTSLFDICTTEKALSGKKRCEHKTGWEAHARKEALHEIHLNSKLDGFGRLSVVNITMAACTRDPLH